MKRCLIGVVFLACALASTGCMSGRGMYRHRERPPVDSTALMSKDDVIALTKAQLGDDIIISMINASGSNFRLRTPDVIELADSGVSDKVIGAMLRSGQPTWYPDSSAGGNYYPPYYRYADYPFWGYADYPFWSPWYPPVYLGYWGGFYRPRYGYRISAPLYGSPYRSNGVRSFGGARGGGRRR